MLQHQLIHPYEPIAAEPGGAVGLPGAETHPAELVLLEHHMRKQTNASTRQTLQPPLRHTMWLHPASCDADDEQRASLAKPPFFSMIDLHFGHSFVLAAIQLAV